MSALVFVAGLLSLAAVVDMIPRRTWPGRASACAIAQELHGKGQFTACAYRWTGGGVS